MSNSYTKKKSHSTSQRLAGHCQVGGPGFRRFDAAWLKCMRWSLQRSLLWGGSGDTTSHIIQHTYQFCRNLAYSPSQRKVSSEAQDFESKCKKCQALQAMYLRSALLFSTAFRLSKADFLSKADLFHDRNSRCLSLRFTPVDLCWGFGNLLLHWYSEGCWGALQSISAVQQFWGLHVVPGFALPR